MSARIYKPAKNAMQSGLANTREWVLEFEPSTPKQIDPLMGWTGSPDTRRQIRLRFDTAAEATAYARRQRLTFVVEPSEEPVMKMQTYADKFRYDRQR